MRQSPPAPDTINSGARDQERTEVHDMMGELKLYGMRNAYDEALATAVKRKHEPQHFVGDLLKAEISEKQARSIKCQLTIAKRLRSMKASCAIWLAATSSLTMSSWVGGRARARRIWRSRSIALRL
jgi:hypothetical protein